MLLRIRELRIAANMQQKVFAKSVGIAGATAHAWETGTALPSAAKLPKIASVLGVTIDALYSSGDNSIVPENEG